MPRTLTIAAFLLGLVGIAATGAALFFVAGLAPLPSLLMAFVALLGALYAALAILITTNTRRPAGRDPDAEPPTWGRRSEDKGLIETISEAMEREAAKRPFPSRTPDWIKDDADVRE